MNDSRPSGIVIEIDEPDLPTRRVRITEPVEIGRDCDGLVVTDSLVSRRHLALGMSASGATVVDLGSRNGTMVNGERILSEVFLRPGDLVEFGRTRLNVVAEGPGDGDAGGPAVSDTPADSTGAGDGTSVRVNDAVIVRYQSGTAGEQAAPRLATEARRARRRLAGLGSEPWGLVPELRLVDPFPDPARPGVVITDGTFVDSSRNEIWMVVTAEAPPEPPERALALLFGASLPAAGELGPLLEGYGLMVAGVPDPAPQLREVELPPMAAAQEEVRVAMGLSFVSYLVHRASRADVLRFFSSAQPGRLEVAAEEVFGSGLASLEQAWRQGVEAGRPEIETGEFLRLSRRYLRPLRRKEAEIVVYMLLGLAFTAVFPFIFRRVIDKAIPTGRYAEVLALLAVLGGAFVVSTVADLRRAYLSAYISGSVIRQLRTEMFDRIQRLSIGWFTQRQQGDVLARLFTDVAVLEGGLSQALREGVFQLLNLVVAGVLLLALSLPLGIIVLLGAPLIAVVYRAMAKGARLRSLAVQQEGGALASVAAENLGAQQVVKAFGLESRESSRFARATERVFTKDVRLKLYGGLFGLSVNMIVTCLRLFVLAFGAWLVLQGNLTVGGLVAFLTVMGQVIAPVTTLSDIGQRVQAATGALLRINEILDTPIDADGREATPLPELAQEIRFANVTFSYDAGAPALEEVSLTVDAGTRVAFVGPTGAGKSSLLQLVMRFYGPDEGQIFFDGRDISGGTVESLRGQLGVVFQETFLFNATIRENIALGAPGASDADVAAAAQAAELDEFVTSLPGGYDTLVGERGVRLSGGQRQRLAIARALVRRPRVVLLDEATSALDAGTEARIAETLRKVGEGRTMIAVTHRLTSVTDYDRIFVLVNGRIVEAGRHDQLISTGGAYSELWRAQTGEAEPPTRAVDPIETLRRLPFFAGLGPSDLGSIAGKMAVAPLRSGEATTGEGGLLVVRSGRARVLAPGLNGAPAQIAELGPGDPFGVAALLGRDTGATLEALEDVELLVLDREAMKAVAAAHPPVRDVLAGRVPTPAPAAGRRLNRASVSSLLTS